MSLPGASAPTICDETTTGVAERPTNPPNTAPPITYTPTIAINIVPASTNFPTGGSSAGLIGEETYEPETYPPTVELQVTPFPSESPITSKVRFIIIRLKSTCT